MNRSSHWLPRLLLIWSASAIAVFCIMLTRKSESPALFGRFSVLVVMALTSLLAGSFVALSARHILLTQPGTLNGVDQRLAAWRSFSWFVPLILMLCIGILSLIFFFLKGDAYFAHNVLFFFIVFSVIIFGLAVLFGGSNATNPIGRPYVFMICLVALIVIALLTIDRRPALLQADEGFFASDIQSILNSGGAVTRPLMYRFAFQNDVHGGLWTSLALPYFRVTGLSLGTGRLFFFLLILASLPCLFVSLRHQYGSVAGWTGTLLALYAFSASNVIRPEAESALFLAAAFCFYSLAEKRQAFHFMTGLTAAMCLDGSLIAYCFGLGFGIFYLGHYLNQIRTKRNWLWSPFWLLLGGEIVVVIYFLITHPGNWSTAGIIQSRPVFTSQETTLQLASQYIASIGQHITSGTFIGLTRDWLYSFFAGQPLISSFAAIGLGVSIWQRKPMDVLLITLFGTWLIVIILTYVYFPQYDITSGMPLVAALAARGAVAGLSALIRVNPLDNAQYRRAFGILLSALLLVATAADIRAASAPGHSLNDVVKISSQISEMVPKDKVIVADEPFYFGMIDHQNFVEASENILMTTNLNYSGTQAWNKIAPDAVVFSTARPPGHTAELDAYMRQQHFGIAACWQTVSYGRIELWMRDPPTILSTTAVCPLVTN